MELLGGRRDVEAERTHSDTFRTRCGRSAPTPPRFRPNFNARPAVSDPASRRLRQIPFTGCGAERSPGSQEGQAATPAGGCGVSNPTPRPHVGLRWAARRDREGARWGKTMKIASVCVGVTLLSLAAGPDVAAQGSCGWSGVGVGLVSVFALTAFDDGAGPSLYAGGQFSSGIAKWNGVTWSPLGNGVSGGPFGSFVNALTVFDDGGGAALYVGGDFTTAGGVPASNIAKWDGVSWSAVSGGVGTVGALAHVSTLTVFDDGSGPALYAGGKFTMAGGMPVESSAKWDGTSWSAVGSGLQGVSVLTVHDDGAGPSLYAGARIDPPYPQRVMKWDGASWLSFAGHMNLGVVALTTFDDGTGPALYAGGHFSWAGGSSTGRVAKWNGTSWESLGSGIAPTSGPCETLSVFDDGTGPALYAAGEFTMAGGVPANRIARWDASGWSDVGGGVTGVSIHTLAFFDQGTGPALYAGGRFYSAGGVFVSSIAKWSCGSTISLTATQAAPGSSVYVNGTNLTLGNEYFNLFSVVPCAGGPGTGPAGTLGLCGDPAFLVSQLLAPLGTPPTHFIADDHYINWGPYPPFMAPVTLEGLCLDVTGGVLGPVSPVVRITVQ